MPAALGSGGRLRSSHNPVLLFARMASGISTMAPGGGYLLVLGRPPVSPAFPLPN